MRKILIALCLLTCTLIPVQAELLQLHYPEFQGAAYNPMKIIAIAKITAKDRHAIKVVTEDHWTDIYYYKDVKARDTAYRRALESMGYGLAR